MEEAFRNNQRLYPVGSYELFYPEKGEKGIWREGVL